MTFHELEYSTELQPTMDRDQARNLVLHGDPNGPKNHLEIVDRAAIPADLSDQFGQPYVVEKILNKAAPRPTLPEVEIKMTDTTIDMSTPEAVAAEFARLEEQLKGTSAGLFGKGFVKTTKAASEQIVSTPRHATRGEEQRVIIYNKLRAKANNWAKEIYEGGDPVHTVGYRQKDGIQEGITAEVQLRITPHVIFALKAAHKSMYTKELAHGPTQDLADMAMEAKFDEHVVENELLRRKLKIETDTNSSTQNEAQTGETEETTQETRKSPKDLREEVEKEQQHLEKATLEEQVIFSLREVQATLRSQRIMGLDEPNPEAGKRIKAMMEVSL